MYWHPRVGIFKARLLDSWNQVRILGQSSPARTPMWAVARRRRPISRGST